MSGYWLCDAGDTLFRQVNQAYPKRDKASDGWIGDSSHAAAKSDHNPCWTCPGDHRGVVRAVDIDASFGGPPGYNTTTEAWRFANQLRQNMLDGDDRISYIIAYDPDAKQTKICSMNPSYQPRGVWRDYTGNSHQNHVHVSFTVAGDFHGRTFDLPVLRDEAAKRRRLVRIIDRLRDTGHRGGRRVRRLLRKLRHLRRN